MIAMRWGSMTDDGFRKEGNWGVEMEMEMVEMEWMMI
jgi:hypothetical protein